MPLFTPSRRWQPAFYPFKDRTFTERLEESFERSIKGILWGCRMCGNCLLQETAFICPMACPKGLRNGPCGGSSPEHCCVDESRPCIWHAIYTRAEKMNRLDMLLEILPPLDWEKTGTSALRDVSSKARKLGYYKTLKSVTLAPPEKRKENWDTFFREIRQPEWWAGDSNPHPTPAHEPVSDLHKKLNSGKFTITFELTPPVSADLSSFTQELAQLHSSVDAVNITDGASAMPRTSAFSAALKATSSGVEPVLQMAARDRTRISFQADLLGASASGIHNVLVISGDHPNKGTPPFSRMSPWDYDSIQGIWMARKLRDDGITLDGREVITHPKYFIGAAAAPFASEPRFQAIRAEKKINAGAQFFQTNLVFDIPGFEAYLEALDKRNLLSRVFLLVGLTPLTSLKKINHLLKLPGIHIPGWMIDRITNATDPKLVSHQLFLELITRLQAMPGVHGLHFMAMNNITYFRQVLAETGLNEITIKK